MSFTRPAEVADQADKQWLMLAVLLLGQFMCLLDVFVVNVAPPTIGADLDASGASLQLVAGVHGRVCDVVDYGGPGSGPCMAGGGNLPSPRARYCKRACQQRGYRLRHQTPTVDLTRVRNALQRRKALMAHTVYECGGCGERFIGERRCDARGLFCRALGLGGLCTECDTPVLVDDLLGEGLIATA